MTISLSNCDVPLEIFINLLQSLGQADLRTLLLAQRVCKAWRDVIQQTAALQATLYFRPSAIPKAAGSGHHDDPEAFNPLLQSLFGGILQTNSDTDPDAAALDRASDRFQRLPWARRSAASRAPFLRASASWRRMLIVHRPLHTLHIFRSTSAMLGKFIDVSHVDFADHSAHGCLTMGAYFDLLLSGTSTVSGAWQLLPAWRVLHPEDPGAGKPGTRSRDVEQMLPPSDCWPTDVLPFLARAPDEAVLAAVDQVSCVQDYKFPERGAWEPRAIGEAPPVVEDWSQSQSW